MSILVVGRATLIGAIIASVLIPITRGLTPAFNIYATSAMFKQNVRQSLRTDGAGLDMPRVISGSRIFHTSSPKTFALLRNLARKSSSSSRVLTW